MLSLARRLLPHFGGSGAYEALPSSPREVSEQYVAEIDAVVGDDHLPLVAQSYIDALNDARFECKYLVVCLDCEEHDLSHKFRTKILGSQALSQELNNAVAITVWGGSVLQREPFQVMAMINCTRLPCIAVQAFPGNNQIPSLLMRFEGDFSDLEIIAAMRQVRAKYDLALARRRVTLESKIQARNLRAEQDAAFQRSLQMDRDKKRRAEEAERRRNDLQRQKVLARMWRHQTAAKFQSEPPMTAGNARILFRMPDGRRLTRRFTPETTIGDIYEYIDCIVLHPESGSASDEESTELPDSYEHIYDFNLFVSMPRRQLEPRSAVNIQQDTSIFPSGSIIVELKDEPKEETIE